jgi:hypothetical protein
LKGLDKALAEKVRREEMKPSLKQNDDIDLDQIMEKAFTAKKELKTAPYTINNLKVHNLTSLSAGMLSYLKRLETIQSKHKNPTHYERTAPSQAGQSLQRSTFSFSLDAIISQRHKSWEIPKESMISAADYDRMYHKPNHFSCTPLDAKLIHKIKAVFSLKKNEASFLKPTALNDRTLVGNLTKSNLKHKGKDDVQKIIPGSESDDDIFDDIGEYVPPSKANS